jgi:transcription elongation factor Elf1
MKHYKEGKMKDFFHDSYEPVKNRLECPFCERELTVEQVLEGSSFSWPEENWIYFQCPFCLKHSHIKVMTDLIKTGVLSGFPGPAFVVCSEKSVEDFDVIGVIDCIRCRYNNIEFSFKMKE